MNKLRQITSGAVYDEDRGVHVIHDVKVKAVRQLMCLGNLLVFTDFIHERDRVAALPGVDVFQPSMVKAWNTGEVKCMTAHCRSVGAGLNLQGGGSLGAWVTMPYSPLEYFQANSRLHRTGQTEPVTIYRIIAEDTIDEAIAEVLRRKSAEQAKMMTSEVFEDGAADAVASVLSSMRRRRA